MHLTLKTLHHLCGSKQGEAAYKPNSKPPGLTVLRLSVTRKSIREGVHVVCNWTLRGYTQKLHVTLLGLPSVLAFLWTSGTWEVHAEKCKWLHDEPTCLSSGGHGSQRALVPPPPPFIYSYILISTGEGAENSISSSFSQSIPKTSKTLQCYTHLQRKLLYSTGNRASYGNMKQF